MTALLVVLFGVAALLALGSLACSIRTYAGAALAIGRQLEACSEPQVARPHKSLGQHRRKARPTSRAVTRRGLTACGLRRERIVSAPQSGVVRMIGRRRQFGLGLGLVSPGTLVFE